MVESDRTLDIQDYLDATSDSSRRARTVSFAVVIASVIVFAGLLNSLQASWMLQRIQALNGADSRILSSRIGPPSTVPELPGVDIDEAYEKRFDQWYQAYVRAYVENTYYIRVPFFGFGFDVNDLGLLGGVAFLVLLVLLRFCLSREIDNLRISFEEANKLNQLPAFYYLLAMRQVLTVPPTRHLKRSRFLVIIPKATSALPLLIHGAVIAHDIATMKIGQVVSDVHTRLAFGCELFLLLFILAVTVMVVGRLRRIDDIWEEWWEKLSGVETALRPSSTSTSMATATSSS